MTRPLFSCAAETKETVEALKDKNLFGLKMRRKLLSRFLQKQRHNQTTLRPNKTEHLLSRWNREHQAGTSLDFLHAYKGRFSCGFCGYLKPAAINLRLDFQLRLDQVDTCVKAILSRPLFLLAQTARPVTPGSVRPPPCYSSTSNRQ